MEFAFITDVANMTEIEVLAQLYNLVLSCLYFAIMYVGYKVIIRVLRKGSMKWEN